MRDREIDDMLKRAAGGSPEVEPALLGGIAESLGAGVRPVRPLPAPWILTGALVSICVAVAVVGAMLVKPYGVLKMNAVEIGLLFSVLGVLVWTSSMVSVAEMIPGRRRLVAPWLLCVGGCLALAAVFGLLFDDYRMEGFVPLGVACLKAGVLLALPAGVATWWLLGRGFAVNSAAAGLAKGTLAGLAGLTMLELHCPIFQAPHALVWHIAVLPVCGLAGMLVSKAGARRAV